MILSSIGSCYKIEMKRIQILILLCASVCSLIGMYEEKVNFAQQFMQLIKQVVEQEQNSQEYTEYVLVKTFDGEMTKVPLWQIDQISKLSKRLRVQKNKNNGENSSIDISDIVMKKMIADSKDVQITANMLDNLVKASNKNLFNEYTDFFTKLAQEDKNNLINTAAILGAKEVFALSAKMMLLNKKVFNGHSKAVNCVAYSSDGKYIISGSEDKTLILWDAHTGKQVRIFEGHTNEVSCVAYSPDGDYIISGSDDKTLILWDAYTGKQVRIFEGHTGPVQCVAYSPDGRHMISGSLDSNLILWDVHTGKQIRIFKGFIRPIFCMAYSPDGKYMVSGAIGKTFILWDVNTGEQIRTFEGHDGFVYCVVYSTDGKYIVSGAGDNTLILWDAYTGERIKSFKGHNVRCIAFSPDGEHIVFGSSDKMLIVLNVKTGEQIRCLKGHNDTVWCVTYSTDGKYIVSGSADKAIIVWSLIDEEALEYVEKILH